MLRYGPFTPSWRVAIRCLACCITVYWSGRMGGAWPMSVVLAWLAECTARHYPSKYQPGRLGCSLGEGPDPPRECLLFHGGSGIYILLFLGIQCWIPSTTAIFPYFHRACAGCRKTKEQCCAAWFFRALAEPDTDQQWYFSDYNDD